MPDVLTSIDRIKAVSRYLSGEQLADIAADLGVTGSNILQITRLEVVWRIQEVIGMADRSAEWKLSEIADSVMRLPRRPSWSAPWAEEEEGGTP